MDESPNYYFTIISSIVQDIITDILFLCNGSCIGFLMVMSKHWVNGLLFNYH